MTSVIPERRLALIHRVMTGIGFYMVPLGPYFKPRRQTKSRETFLREYAMDVLEIFQKVLPARITSS